MVDFGKGLYWLYQEMSDICWQDKCPFCSFIEKKLEITRKEAKNPEKESIFSLLGKLLNFDEEVKLNEHTPSLLIFIFILLFVMFVMYHLKSFITLKAMIIVLKSLDMLWIYLLCAQVLFITLFWCVRIWLWNDKCYYRMLFLQVLMLG